MAFWLPQNIQRRLILYVLQQITLFSNVDITKLDVSLGSHSKFTFQDVDLNISEMNIPGCEVNSGMLGKLMLGLTVSGDVHISGDNIDFMITMINEDDFNDMNSFSLAKSFYDLTSSIMQFKPDAHLKNEISGSGSDSPRIPDDYTNPSSAGGNPTTNTYDIIVDDTASSTTESDDSSPIDSIPTSRFNIMQQKVIATALAKLKITLQSVRIRINLGKRKDCNCLDVVVKRIDMSTSEGHVRNFDANGISIAYINNEPSVVPPNNMDMAESLYFSQADASSIYMSALSDANTDIKSLDASVFNSERYELLSINGMSFSFVGISSIDDFAISRIKINLGTLQVNIPFLLKVREDIILTMIFKLISPRHTDKVDVKNSPAYKRFQNELHSNDTNLFSNLAIEEILIGLSSNQKIILRAVDLESNEINGINLSVGDIDLVGLDMDWISETSPCFNASFGKSNTIIELANTIIRVSEHDLILFLKIYYEIMDFIDFVLSKWKILGVKQVSQLRNDEKFSLNVGSLVIEIPLDNSILEINIPNIEHDSLNQDLKLYEVNMTHIVESIKISSLKLKEVSIDLSSARKKMKCYNEHFSQYFVFTHYKVQITGIDSQINLKSLWIIGAVIEQFYIASPVQEYPEATNKNSVRFHDNNKRLLSTSLMINKRAILAKYIIELDDIKVCISGFDADQIRHCKFSLQRLLFLNQIDKGLLFNIFQPHVEIKFFSGSLNDIIRSTNIGVSGQPHLILCIFADKKIKVSIKDIMIFYQAKWLDSVQRNASLDQEKGQNVEYSELPEFSISIRDSAINFLPFRINPSLVILFESIIVTKSGNDALINMHSKVGRFYLTDNYDHLKTTQVMNKTICDSLIKSGYSQIGKFEGLSMTLNKKHKIVNCNGCLEKVILSVCSDSFHTLVQLCMDLKVPVTFPDDKKYQPVPSVAVDLFETIEENEFNLSNLDNKDIDKSIGSDSDSLHIVNSFLDEVEDFQFHEDYNSGTVWSHTTSDTHSSSDILPISLKEEYLDSRRTEVQKHSQSNDRNIISEIDFDIKNADIRLYDGYDWRYTRKNVSSAISELEEGLLSGIQRQEQTESELSRTTVFDSICIATKQKDLGNLKQIISEQVQGKHDHLNSDKVYLYPSKHYKSLIKANELIFKIKIYDSNSPRNEEFNNHAAKLFQITASISTYEVLDNLPTSTWNKFVTLLKKEAWPKSEPMLYFDFMLFKPINSLEATEATINIRSAPLRIHADQYMVDFLLRFFQFNDKRFELIDEYPEILFLQKFKSNTIKLRIDYKPNKTSSGMYSGKISDLINLFVLDESKVTLKGVVLHGINGFNELSEQLVKIWGNDVTSKQIFNILQGFAPVKSFIALGAGAQTFITVLLAEYKRDRSISRSVKKSGNIFIKTTTGDFIKLGAKLAVGTQALLENTEGILSGNATQNRTLADVSQTNKVLDLDSLLQQDQVLIGRNPKIRNKSPSAIIIDAADLEESGRPKVVSLYSEQPLDLHKGLEEAYHALEKHIQIAYNTIWQTNQELRGEESRSAKAAAVTIAKAAPVAVIRPMIGATEAIAKTLQGIYNQLDKSNIEEINDKYKKEDN